MDEKRIPLAELRDWCKQASSDLHQHMTAQQCDGAVTADHPVKVFNHNPTDRIVLSGDPTPTFAQDCMRLLAEKLLEIPYCPPQIIEEIYGYITSATDEVALACLARLETLCCFTIDNPAPIDEATGAVPRGPNNGPTNPWQKNPACRFDRNAMLLVADLGERVAKFLGRHAISEIGVNWFIPIFECVERIERARNPEMYGPLSFGRRIVTCEGGTEGMAAVDMLFGLVDRVLFQWRWERICIEDFSDYDWYTAREECPQTELLSSAYGSPAFSSAVIGAFSEAVAAIREAVAEDSSQQVWANTVAGKIGIGKLEFDAEPHHCEIVTALVEAEGHYVTGLEMKKLRGCHGKKISREIDRLIETIPALSERIMRGDNRGYRLRS